MATICNVHGCPNIAVNKGRCALHPRPSWQGHRGFEGYKGEYLKNRNQVLKEEPCCRLCGKPAVTVDHIKAKSQGGTDERSNLRGLCQDCHDKRSKEQAAKGRRGN